MMKRLLALFSLIALLATPAAADILFPNAPTTGQVYTNQGRVWQYDGTAWDAITGPAPGVKTQVFTGNGTYTPSPGMRWAIIECVGGGGGGGGADGLDGTHAIAGSGGGGGGFSQKTVTAADVGASQTVTIGTSGTAGSTTPTSGGNGGDTSVGALCVGKGGTGGNLASSTVIRAGGAGGIAGTGDFTIPGEAGGSGGYQSGATIVAFANYGGNAGKYGLGGIAPAGTDFASNTFAGSAGQNYGGGGSGGLASLTASNAAGGAGATGLVVITEYITSQPGSLVTGSVDAPRGRLTLVSNTPVLTSNQTAKSQVFYDCYKGNKVPYYDGVTDQFETIPSCEVSTTMATSGTGVTNNAGVFDVWWVHSGANRLCVATNGAGGGWASDTAGSNTARGTGYSQLDTTTRPYITNKNALTHCYNGATDYGSVSANQATYLGTLYTTAAGQTGMNFNPSPAAGGAANVLGLWNAYNRVTVSAVNQDNTSSWTYVAASWRAVDGNANNGTKYVDGVGQSTIRASYAIDNCAVAASQFGVVGIDRDSTTAQPAIIVSPNDFNFTDTNCTEGYVDGMFLPSVGLHTVTPVENGLGSTAASLNWYGEFSGTLPTEWFKLDMEM